MTHCNSSELSLSCSQLNSTQPCSTVKFLPRPTAGFSSVPNSLKSRRLKASRRDSCLIASDTFITSQETVTLSGRKLTGRPPYRTTTKSTLICFHSTQKGLGLRLGWQSDLVVFPTTTYNCQNYSN